MKQIVTITFDTDTQFADEQVANSLQKFFSEFANHPAIRQAAKYSGGTIPKMDNLKVSVTKCLS